MGYGRFAVSRGEITGDKRNEENDIMDDVCGAYALRSLCRQGRNQYGLYGKEAKTLEDTGKELNITRERVRQIQIKAIKKLAGLNLSKELKSFLWD